MDIYTLRELVYSDRCVFSDHANVERLHEALSHQDLRDCITSGDIIVEESGDQGAEYLIEGQTWLKQRIRVKVALTDTGDIMFITVYSRGRRDQRKRR